VKAGERLRPVVEDDLARCTRSAAPRRRGRAGRSRSASGSDVAHPSWRASAVGVYRLWRDLGYAVGALLAGLTADALGLPAAMWLVAGLTFASGVIVATRMTETLARSGVHPRGQTPDRAAENDVDAVPSSPAAP
jgi:MFS family permease